jgi:hypothetical protein
MMIESKDQNALRREYYKNNKDKCLEYCQTYRNKNMDKFREYAKNYYHEKIKCQPLLICECGQGVRQASMSKHCSISTLGNISLQAVYPSIDRPTHFPGRLSLNR